MFDMMLNRQFASDRPFQRCMKSKVLDEELVPSISFSDSMQWRQWKNRKAKIDSLRWIESNDRFILEKNSIAPTVAF